MLREWLEVQGSRRSGEQIIQSAATESSYFIHANLKPNDIFANVLYCYTRSTILLETVTDGYYA